MLPLPRPIAAALAAGVACGAVLGPSAARAGGPVAERCAPGSTAVAAGRDAILVRRPEGAGRHLLFACRRGGARRVRVGATFGNARRAGSSARSTLRATAIAGPVVAAGFETVAGGCLYERGCGVRPREVLRLADVRRRTLRRLPLDGSLVALAVAPDGAVTFTVDEFTALATFRTAAAPGSAILLVRREPAR